LVGTKRTCEGGKEQDKPLKTTSEQTVKGGKSRRITMGKSRGDRRVIFSSSGAARTTSAPHLRRLPTGTTARTRAGAPPVAEAEAPRAPGAGGAAAGAERHHADAMVGRVGSSR